MKIEKLTKIKTDYYETSPDNFQLMDKINEIVDVVNNITEQHKEEDETSIAVNNPDAYRIGFADDEAHAKEEMALDWLEKKGEQSIFNIPSKEIILAIWELGNDWKELTGGSISTAYGTQLDYIQNHWNESEYYLRAKQDEQKPTNKVEPKFNVGDWITDGYVGGQITSIEDNYPCYKIADFIGGINTSIPFTLQDNYHLWKIQDAKDGDVLYLQKDGKEHIIIYKGIIKERFRTFVSAYCAYNGIVDAFCFADVSRYADIAYGGIMPATKEQRDTLFAKMKEAGYEWDAEKKELKKTNYKPRVADYEDFREWKDEKSEAEMVGMEDPVLQRLDKKLDVLMEIKSTLC